MHEAEDKRGLVLRRIGLVEEADRLEDQPDRPQAKGGHNPQAETQPAPTPEVHRIPVKILVDDDERAARRVWETRLRGRVQEASRLFETQFGIGFEVLAVETWKSGSDADDFLASLSEFEQAVRPEPAKIAIGFTSQYQTPEGSAHMGGTRVPLGSHILVREWSQHFSERERYELLVHELGHYLGAVHSPEAASVMRCRMGDRQALAKNFVVGFDPLNALAVGLVAEQLARRPIVRLTDLPPDKLRRLSEIYETVLQALSKDGAAPELLALVGRTIGRTRIDPAGTDNQLGFATDRGSGATEPPPKTVGEAAAKPVQKIPVAGNVAENGIGPREPFLVATRQVLRAIVERARVNTALTTDPDEIPNADVLAESPIVDGDRLTEAYIQAAAAEALKTPSDQQVKAFFWGLAIGLERRVEMRRYAVLGDFICRVESDTERRRRLQVLGRPTWGGREDLSQHVTFSAAIAVTAGNRAAEAAGMAKELRDARTESGFSFVDWAADLAGIALADRVAKRSITLDGIVGRFQAADYLPDTTGLEEGLSWEDFTQRYGSTSDRRFRTVDADIRRRIKRLADTSAP
ncbi:MAG TPA: M12 family metallo-peptidase [Pirellulales bacterium]|nr:M12 family metallo-peptidase [Pirellulales bacterium]